MFVMVVEDDLAGRALLGMILENTGHRVEGYASGHEAWAAARAAAPDLLITDVRLGDDFSGLDLLSRFRAHPHLQKVPVIVLTGATTAADLQAVRDHGADRCLTKPLDVPELRNAVASLSPAE